MSLADLLRKGSLRAPATATPATFATEDGEGVGSVAPVATVAVAKPEAAALEAALPVGDPEFSSDPDRWCWPSGDAMNGIELDLMQRRIALFQRRGLRSAAAEGQADVLMRRDRDADDRCICLECHNLRGQQCEAWKAAGAGRNVGGMLLLLQRCPAFKSETGP